MIAWKTLSPLVSLPVCELMCTPSPEFEIVSLYMKRNTGSPARLLRVTAPAVPTPPVAPVQSTSMAFVLGWTNTAASLKSARLESSIVSDIGELSWLTGAR